MEGQNSPNQQGGGSVYSRRRKKVVFSHPFSSGYKTVAHFVVQVAPSRKPHKHPILINRSLFITLPLAEFFLL